MMVTERDRKLLLMINNYGMLSTKQARELAFNGIATTTVLRRLRMLEGNHFIKRLIGLESQDVLWVGTSKSIDVTGGELFKRNWNKNSLEHDFKLLELRILLEKSGIAQSWVAEQEIRSLIIKKFGTKAAHDKLVPDGIMITENAYKKMSVAIELELTLKNKQRFKEILSKYLEKKDLSLIWYIGGSRTILNAVLGTWNQLPQSKNNLKLFGSLHEEVIKNPREATLYHIQGKLKVKDLWSMSGAHSPAHRVGTPITAPSSIPPPLTA